MATKVAKKRFLKDRLAYDPRWATKALLVVWGNQTEAEKSSQKTLEWNGVGFSQFDATILTSFAERFSERRSLSPKQMNVLFRRIPHYWKQILAACDQEKLEGLMTG